MDAPARMSLPRDPKSTRRWRLVWMLAIVIVILGVVGGPYLIARTGAPVTYSEADLDHDGWVSLGEALYLFDTGTRSIQRAGVSNVCGVLRFERWAPDQDGVQMTSASAAGGRLTRRCRRAVAKVALRAPSRARR